MGIFPKLNVFKTINDASNAQRDVLKKCQFDLTERFFVLKTINDTSNAQNNQ